MSLRGRKICIFLPTLEHGGAERRMTLLAMELKKKGYDVDVMVLRLQGEFQASLDVAGISIKSIDKRGRLDLLGAAIRAKTIFSRNRYDVVLSCLPSANMFAAIVKLVDRKTPLIWGVAAADMPMGAYGLWAKIGEKVQNFLARFADKIIVNSFKAHAVSVGKGLNPLKLCVIQNGVDTEKFQLDSSAGEEWRRQNKIPVEANVIAIVARLDPAKGIETFLEALSSAESRLEEGSDWYYLIFGSGRSEYAISLKKSIQAHPIYGRRLFLFENTQVGHSIYNAADVVSITSVSESFPNVMLEAMASGSQLVSTDVGDCRQVIKRYGSVIPVADSVALCDAWQALEGHEGGEFSSTQIREYIVNEFSIEQMVSKFEALLLDSLLEKNDKYQ